MNCHPVLLIICGICLGHFASRKLHKSQYLLAFRMSFLVIAMEKEIIIKKESCKRAKESALLDFFLVKSGMMTFPFFLKSGCFKQ